jgi:predicted PurR-regulated permease PerM
MRPPQAVQSVRRGPLVVDPVAPISPSTERLRSVESGFTANAKQRPSPVTLSAGTAVTGDGQRDPCESRTGSALPGTVSIVLACAIVLLALWTARSFLLALIWAAIIAVAAWPIYRRFVAAFPNRRTETPAAALFTLLTGLVVLLPLAYAAVMAGREGAAAARWLAEAQQHGIPAPNWLTHLPYVGDRLGAWWQAHLVQPGAPSHLLEQIDVGSMAAWTGSLGAALAYSSILFFITLLMLFFLLRDGKWLAQTSLGAARQVHDRVGPRMLERLVLAVRGTVIGTVLVALGEGGLISVAYVVAGAPRPALFGALTVACAMVPLGAWIAFTSTSLLLLAQGNVAAAVGLFAYGAVVALVSDYVVQPTLIGGSTRLPFLWALVGALGGIETFGLVGLFVGPVIMAAVLSLMREWIAQESQ